MESWDWLGDRIASAENPAHIDYELDSMLCSLAALAHLAACRKLQATKLPPEFTAMLAQADGQTLMAVIIDAVTLLAQSDVD